MKKKVEYYPWVCPVCGDDSCSDPMTIVYTVCHNGHQVVLSDYVAADGMRVARVSGGEVV
jgi:hypothetical protein